MITIKNSQRNLRLLEYTEAIEKALVEGPMLQALELVRQLKKEAKALVEADWSTDLPPMYNPFILHLIDADEELVVKRTELARAWRPVRITLTVVKELRVKEPGKYTPNQEVEFTSGHYRWRFM